LINVVLHREKTDEYESNEDCDCGADKQCIMKNVSHLSTWYRDGIFAGQAAFYKIQFGSSSISVARRTFMLGHFRPATLSSMHCRSTAPQGGKL
jgi:hypothetical protein